MPLDCSKLTAESAQIAAKPSTGRRLPEKENAAIFHERSWRLEFFWEKADLPTQRSDLSKGRQPDVSVLGGCCLKRIRSPSLVFDGKRGVVRDVQCGAV